MNHFMENHTKSRLQEGDKILTYLTLLIRIISKALDKMKQ